MIGAESTVTRALDGNSPSGVSAIPHASIESCVLSIVPIAPYRSHARLECRHAQRFGQDTTQAPARHRACRVELGSNSGANRNRFQPDRTMFVRSNSD